MNSPERISVRSSVLLIALSLHLLGWWCPSGVEAASDIDASIAKLMNGFGITPGTTQGAAATPRAPPPQAWSQAPPSAPSDGGAVPPYRPGGIFGFGSGLFGSPQQRVQPPPNPPPSMVLANGPVVGRRMIISNLDGLPDISTDECHLFMGIPYAAPPVDQLRFKAPKPPDRFQMPWQAIRYRSACSQQPASDWPYGFMASEDCLYANVFKPAVDNDTTIVVWIHGGAFVGGTAATMNPSTVCRQVVVNTLTVVTLDYRLGPFGFPAHESLPSADTNLGLRDIGQAVKWVQDNAEAFGSRSNRIVLVGHGGGAALVSLLLDSGLINLQSIKGVILMSGSGLAPWALTKHSWNSTSRMLKQLDCSSLECLVVRQVETSKLLENSTRLWSPYVDNTTITNARSRMVGKRLEPRFPIIMGFTAQEGTALAAKKLAPANSQPLKEKIARSVVDLIGDEEDRDETARRYLYERATPMNFFETVYDFIDALADAYSDALFRFPSIREATARTRQQASNVYLYAIRHDLPLPGNSLPGYKASYHGSDLELFWNPYAKQSRVNLLGAFLHVILHQDTTLPWRPWTPENPQLLQVTPYGGSFATFRPSEPNSTMMTTTSTYPNATAKYGNPGLVWTSNSPPRKFTMINAANTTPVSILFNRKKTTGPSWNTSTSGPSSTLGVNATEERVNTTVASSTPMNKINWTTNASAADAPWPTSTKPTMSTSPRSTNSTTDGSAAATPAAVPAAGQQDSLVWVLLGLAVLFLFLFLVTVGGCAAWNRQSYHPHPNRRSRHQGAKVRSHTNANQQRVPPPVAPLEVAGGMGVGGGHGSRSRNKESEGKNSGQRLVSSSSHHHQGGGGGIVAPHRQGRPRTQPPPLPSMPKDPKRG